MVLFKLKSSGETTFDVTPFIVLNTYAVSTQPDFDTWYDGNRTERRGVKRQKLKGTFSIKFFDKKDYADFFTFLESNKTSADYIDATAYDVKKRTTKDSIFYIDYEPANLEPSTGFSFNDEIELTITER